MHCLAKTKYCRNSTQLATLSSFSKLNNIKSDYCDIKSSSTTSSSATPPSQQTLLPSQPCRNMVLFWTISVEETHLHCLRMPLYAVQCAHNTRHPLGNSAAVQNEFHIEQCGFVGISWASTIEQSIGGKHISYLSFLSLATSWLSDIL